LERHRRRNAETEARLRLTEPAHLLTQLFEPFFTTKDHGMGIGLSIVRAIIQAHDGRIWAENMAGGGANFRFILPLRA
jgi:two-component system, LuxR family, sensor kinase FixL